MPDPNSRQVLLRALGYYRKGEPVPLLLANLLVNGAGRTGDDKEISAPSIIRAAALTHERRFLEAILEICQTLRSCGTQIEAQAEAQSILCDIAIEIEKSAQTDPMKSDLGEIYDQLFALGMVPLRLHAYAVQHFSAVGQLDRANDIEKRLKKVAPHLFDLEPFRCELGDAVVLPYPAMSRRNTVRANGNDAAIESCVSLLELFSKVQSLDGEKSHTAVVDTCRKAISLPGISAENKDYFRYYEACALDYLGKPLEALEILSELVDRYPSHLKYARSLTIVRDNIAAEAVRLAEKEPESGALVHFASILDRIDYCPYQVKAALSLKDAREGRQAQARQRMEPLLELSPHDFEYLESTLDVAKATKDSAWMEKILVGIRTHVRRHPYLIRHQALLRRYSENQSQTSEAWRCSNGGGES